MTWYSAIELVWVIVPVVTRACYPGLKYDKNSMFDNKIEIRIAPRLMKITTAQQNVRIVDGYQIQPPSTVYMDGGTIVSNKTTVDTLIDGQGGVLLPGLTDSHCHPRQIACLETLSSYGITTALSMACGNYNICANLHDQIGLTCYITTGYPAIGPNSTHPHGLPPARLINSPAQPEAWVNNTFEDGGSYLKIVAETNGPDQETQNVLVKFTHATGRKTMTHAADHASYVQAILSGMDGSQHVPVDGILNDTMLELMVAQRQYATPSIDVFKYIFANTSAFGPQAANTNTTAAFRVVQENVWRFRAHGIPILAGTDAVSTGWYPFAVPFGTSLHDEHLNLVQFGVSNAEATRSATITPALHHGLHDRGIIAPGMKADLVLLKPGANPINGNITDTRKTTRAWNTGIGYMNVAES